MVIASGKVVDGRVELDSQLPEGVSALAAEHLRAAEEWWRVNRPKAPGAILGERERAASLIAMQPGIGTLA